MEFEACIRLPSDPLMVSFNRSSKPVTWHGRLARDQHVSGSYRQVVMLEVRREYDPSE